MIIRLLKRFRRKFNKPVPNQTKKMYHHVMTIYLDGVVEPVRHVVENYEHKPHRAFLRFIKFMHVNHNKEIYTLQYKNNKREVTFRKSDVKCYQIVSHYIQEWD